MLKDKTELLHFLKGSLEPFSKDFLSPIKKEYKNWCAFANHGDAVDPSCYLIVNSEIGWLDYLEHFVWSIKYLSGDNEAVVLLNEKLNALSDPSHNRTSEEFEDNLKQLVAVVKRVESDIKEQLDNLTCLECQRLGEAITCLRSGCFRSSTVMAVSAVEARLHTLLSKKNKSLYKKHFEKAALGGIIKLFDKTEFTDPKFKNLKKMMPEKHKPLLDLINSYRIFSAHPKDEVIDFRIAETILNLCFTILEDKSFALKDKAMLKHGKD